MQYFQIIFKETKMKNLRLFFLSLTIAMLLININSSVQMGEVNLKSTPMKKSLSEKEESKSIEIKNEKKDFHFDLKDRQVILTVHIPTIVQKSEEIVDQVGFTASLEGEDSLSFVVERLRTITWYIRIGG